MKRLLLIATFCLLTWHPPSAQAQGLLSGWTTDVGLAVGGAAFPQGDRLGGVDVGGGLESTGFTVAGSIGLRPASSPLGYRLEVQYTRLGLDEDMRFGGGGAPVVADGTASVLSGTGNVVLGLFSASPLRFYLIGGVGAYRLSSDIDYTTPDGRFIRYLSVPLKSKTRFGLNGGAGLEFAVGPLRSFVEARLHGVFSGDNGACFIPIVIGIRSLSE